MKIQITKKEIQEGKYENTFGTYRVKNGCKYKDYRCRGVRYIKEKDHYEFLDIIFPVEFIDFIQAWYYIEN